MFLHRREFGRLCAAALSIPSGAAWGRRFDFDLYAIERPRVVKMAEGFLFQKPITVTVSHSDRSAGGLHDYFSEGDYWWPDPKNPKGPYIRRDGMSNPGNFDAHRKALLRLSVQAPALCAAWVLTKRRMYAQHAAEHLRAWFLNKDTRMNPNLQYAQAIHGRVTGRGTGIIDTIHLVEVFRGASGIEASGVLTPPEQDGLRQWVADYLQWMRTSQEGKEEGSAKNNHGTCWVMQAAEFATYTRDAAVEVFCRRRFKDVLLPTQMAANGSFPLELARTKPYGYSLFNLETMAAVCQILSHQQDDLWTFQLPDCRGMARAMAFMTPYIADKSKWPRRPDVMYFDNWPLQQQSLLFAGLALREAKYLTLWQRLNPHPPTEEAVRNYPIRQPVLWVSKQEALT